MVGVMGRMFFAVLRGSTPPVQGDFNIEQFGKVEPVSYRLRDSRHSSFALQATADLREVDSTKRMNAQHCNGVSARRFAVHRTAYTEEAGRKGDTTAPVAITTCASAFTLIELVSVISIMLLLLGLAVTASIGWGRGAAMRTSHKMVLSSLSSARQQAIASGKTVAFSCTNRIDSDRGSYVLFDKKGDLGNTNSLARGIVFASNTQARVWFRSDGTCLSAGTNRILNIILRESSGPLSATIEVYTATGHSTIAR